METIQQLRQKYDTTFAKQHCGIESTSRCEREFCYCKQNAEIWAYIEYVLPEGYEKLTVFDWDGFSKNGKQVLPTATATEVKNVICNFCWGKSWIDLKSHFEGDEEKIKQYMNKHSIMSNRLRDGNCVVIHGVGKGIGSSMCASIIIKEAIKLRKLAGQRGQTYNWIDMSSLKKAVEDDYSYSSESLVAANCISSDWLVVDDIPSMGMSTHRRDLMNAFFMARLKAKKPTILIFKFNIENTTFDLDEAIGTGVRRVIQSKRTTTITL